MAIASNDKHNIGDLLNHRNPFVIPKHQRAYSWDEDEVEAFCDDIDRLCKMNPPKEYFFGGIVSVHEISSNTMGRIFSVVDGQQRLATFTLLLGQIRNAFRIIETEATNSNDNILQSSAKTCAECIETQFLYYVDVRRTPPKKENILTLSLIDQTYYDNLINNRIQSGQNTFDRVSHKRLYEAWQTIEEKLISPIINNTLIDFAQKFEKIKRLQEILLDYCVVIHITCNDKTEAYQLFEVLNDRGKDLATGDYLRSNSMELLDTYPIEQAKVQSDWDEILSNQSSTEFLRVYLSSKKGKVSRGKELHTIFRQAFFNFAIPISTTNANNIRDTLAEMNKFIDVFNKLRIGKWPYSNPIAKTWEKERLNMLTNTLGHSLCLPLLLSLWDKHTENTFVKVVMLLEKVVFRYITICSKRANKLGEIYYKHNDKIQTNKFTIADFEQELKDLLLQEAPLAYFSDLLIQKLTYENSKRSRNNIRYFLSSLEDYYPWYKNAILNTTLTNLTPTPTLGQTTNFDSINIEHIYPQSANPTDLTLEPYKNTIGNLTFWDPNDNRAASNTPFVQKKNLYRNSRVGLTAQLDVYATWDDTSLKSNETLYKDMAEKIFAI